MKKITLTLAACLIAFSSCNRHFRAFYDVTLGTLLDEMVDRDAITCYPSIAYKQAQVSSYDRRTVSPEEDGWWANDDGAGYERLDTVEGRCEKVMCDLVGAGVVTRIWMTTKEKFGTIRFYLDGAEKPQIVIPAYDMARFPIEVPAGLSLTHTHYEEAMNGVGGNSFFLPIPFGKACKITFEEPDMNVKIPRYYHIGYRMYAEGTKVKTFTLKEAKVLKSKIERVSEELLNPGEISSRVSSVKSATLAGGETLVLDLPCTSSSKISKLTVKASCIDSLSIGGIFDGKLTIDAPLAHFAGAGMGAPEVRGWWLSNSGGEVVCRYPMPYLTSGQISITNKGASGVHVELTADISAYEWTENSLYFHVSHRSEMAIPVSPNYDSNDNLDWNFMTIKGRGNYVGDLLSLNNHSIDWYGEGDEKIFVDGETFPSFMGTGTEDYFNCSWAPVVPFLSPFGGAPRADEESSHGINAFLRTRILDAIPFTESFRFDIEMLSWHPGTVDYHATSYWYGDASNTVNSTKY